MGINQISEEQIKDHEQERKEKLENHNGLWTYCPPIKGKETSHPKIDANCRPTHVQNQDLDCTDNEGIKEAGKQAI